MLKDAILIGIACILTASAQYQGFNYGSNNADGTPAVQSNFEDQFNFARNLVGHHGFTSARLYTMIQSGTTDSVTEAIPAAIATKTSLLLGMWASAGQEAFNNELAALSTAFETYGSALTDLIVGLSVGSEDLYRMTPTGMANQAGVGASPKVVAKYIQQTRKLLRHASINNVKVGHVDTWTAWVNSSNTATIEASDFCGVDSYPYFQSVNDNSIENGPALFDDAYQATIAAVGSREVWITETGWPLSGPQFGDAVASVSNAKYFWDAVACKYLGQVNTWWYTLYDGAASPSFGLTGSSLSNRPVFNLRCPKGSTSGQVGVAKAKKINHKSKRPKEVKISSSRKHEPKQKATHGKVISSKEQKSEEKTVESKTSNACPAKLSTFFQYPHLMVQVDSAQPDTAIGSSGNAKLSSTVATIFNFDIPSSYQGMTCSVVFLFPRKTDLQTSTWTKLGNGGIAVKQLPIPSTAETTYNGVPSTSKDVGGVSSAEPGNSYIIATGPCAAGQTISYLAAATGNFGLEFFQVYSPTPIGMYVTAC